MTTAHRPTWKAAVGRAQEGGWNAGGAPSASSSVLDAAAHTKLKLRAGPQVVSDDKKAILQASLAKLEEAERNVKGAGRLGVGGRKYLALEGGGVVDAKVEEEGRRRLLKHTAEVDDIGIKSKYNDDDDDDKDDDGGGGGNWSDVEEAAKEAASDSDSDLDASDSDLDDSDDDSDDEDEEAALQAELAKIRAEREAVKLREEAEEAAEEEAKLEEAALTGNPLLSATTDSSSGRLKRKWNDDVVFRNQAKGEPDYHQKRFINDTVRNDFHKRFLNKFIR
mmetsp:Transcript_1901/g.2911  ORF Transcript_1901/g.2911 Transcript_1901/m.2911 type:complete len:279 (+) Transcript_1901:130-966(+)